MDAQALCVRRPPRAAAIATLGASNRAEAVFKAREMGLI